MIERLLAPIKARIRLMVGRCLITACKNGRVSLTLLADESRDDVDFYQQYGFSSRPKGDVDAVALFIGGSRDNGVVVASRGRSSDMSMSLEEGEVAVHSPFGSSILLKKDGSVEMATNSNKFRFVGDIEATGNIKAMCDGAFVTLSGHIHPTGVGPSSQPTPGQ